MRIDFDKLNALLELNKTEVDYPDLALIGEQVVGVVESHLQRIIEQGDYIEMVYAQTDSTKMIPLKALPVSKINSITVNGVAITNYFQVPYGIRLGEPVKDSLVTVNYTGGYEEVPVDLERAVLTQICYEYQQKHSIGLQTVSSDGGTIVKPKGALLPEVLQMLAPYKHPFRSF